MDQNEIHRWWEEILPWVKARGRGITEWFAKTYAWMYDLPYEEGTTTSEAIAKAEAGIDPYASEFGWRMLGTPASPIDYAYHLIHGEGYQLEQTEAYENGQFYTTPDPSGVFVTPPGGLITADNGGFFEEERVRPPAMLPGGGMMIDPGGPLEGYVDPAQVQQAVRATLTSMQRVDPWDYMGQTYIPTIAGGSEPMVMTDPITGTFPPSVNGRTLIKTWIGGPKSSPRRFWLFWIGRRKYMGCYKNDGTWSQWPVYKPLVIGKTMTDRKAKRIARKMDSYMKSVRKIARILGWTLKR